MLRNLGSFKNERSDVYSPKRGGMKEKKEEWPHFWNVKRNGVFFGKRQKTVQTERSGERFF